MLKIFKTGSLLTIAILLTSFTNKQANQFYGTFGVCANNPSQIKLTIHPDHTFYFQDYSVFDNKIVAKGTWTLKGNKVILKSDDTNQKFHQVWSFNQNGQVAKSRKGWAFYRLNKIQAE